MLRLCSVDYLNSAALVWGLLHGPPQDLFDLTFRIPSECADLVASGAVDFDIAATYPLDRVADAFEELEQRHTHGKIVLLPQDSVS